MGTLGTDIAAIPVTPLDDQLGANPVLQLPIGLQGQLFNIPTYAILDAGQISHLPELLDASGLEHRCLFMGEAAEKWGAQAPWLVRLEKGAPLTRHLFTDGAVAAPWDLWRAGGAILLTEAGFDAVWGFLRRFTRLKGPDGNWFMFRFWERLVLPALCADGDPLAAALAWPVQGQALTWFLPDPDAQQVLKITRSGDGPPPPLRLTDKTLATLARATDTATRNADIAAALSRVPAPIAARFRGHPDLEDLWARLRDIGFRDPGQRQDAMALYLQATAQDTHEQAWTILTSSGPGPQVRVWQLQQVLEGAA